ncbi:442_t:CDS:2 [Funneliformis caledonium]|uniref:442_t:CDS:1 n=1 Tax=Funneliformis caledonium TaxID=1117310 RepID=A0A9N9D484_9GLOM|nr:442_t:CDS:2 [Funneliformis caledonium]
MPNTTTTSTAAHLATILMNPITTQYAIPNMNIHNPRLVDAKLIKLNLNNRFMTLLSLSHNQRWGFRSVDDSTKLEELTVHSYDTRLKEKWDARSMKNVVLIDLQENNLHSLNAYIKAINAIVNPNIPSKKRHKINEIFISLTAMKILEARLCHFPLGFNTLHRPDPFQYCDASNSEVEDLENNTLCDDDDESEPIEYVACVLEEALRKFQQQ